MRLLSRLLARADTPPPAPARPESADAVAPSAGLDEDLRDLLRRCVNSPIKMDLVVYLHDNPFSIETARNLALRLGRDTSLVETCAADLQREGVLLTSGSAREDSAPLYRLTTDAELRGRMARLVALYRGGSACEIRAAIRDISIADAVRSAVMSSHRVSALDINIRCASGTVLIEGRVNTPNERAELDLICERLSQSRYGIRSIRNAAVVEARATADDGRIREEARKALQERAHLLADGGDTGALHVAVDVTERIAYLTGLVESPQDRSRASQVVQEVPGVADVVNWLDVQLRRSH